MIRSRSRGMLVAGAFVALLALAFFFGGGGMAMAKPLVLCSAFEGRLVDADGRPAAGYRVTRNWTWAWTGKTGSDSTETDAEGRFHLPEVTGRSLTAGLLPHQPLIRQRITAAGPEAETLIWEADKPNYDRDGELRGRPIRAVCRVGVEPDGSGLFHGTCRSEG